MGWIANEVCVPGGFDRFDSGFFELQDAVCNTWPCGPLMNNRRLWLRPRACWVHSSPARPTQGDHGALSPFREQPGELAPPNV